MNKLKLDNLIVKDENYIIYGDLEISGRLVIENCDLIVSGTLSFTDKCTEISIKGGNISAGEIQLSRNNHSTILSINDGDIFVAENLTSSIAISSDGEITVHGDLISLEAISCMNLFVYGYIISNSSIESIQDVYFLNNCDCNNLSARDVFAGGYLNLNGYPLKAFGSLYVVGSILNCPSITVGR